ncbi:hypothetical protein HN873_006956 [Arachis hypogaea]
MLSPRNDYDCIQDSHNNPWHEEKGSIKAVTSMGLVSEQKTREMTSLKIKVEKMKKNKTKHGRKRCSPAVNGYQKTSTPKIERKAKDKK